MASSGSMLGSMSPSNPPAAAIGFSPSKRIGDEAITSERNRSPGGTDTRLLFSISTGPWY